MNDKTKPDAAPEDAAQAAELAALQAAAAADPAAPAPEAGSEEAGAPPVDLAAELSGLLQVVTGILSPALPSLKEIYTAESCGQAGAAIAAVCNKRGWLQGGVLGGYGEELAALAIVGPMAVATYQGVSKDLEEMRRAKKPAAPPAPPPVVAGSPGEPAQEDRPERLAVTIGSQGNADN